MAEPAVARDWWISIGMAVSATAAAVSSFAGLRELAVVAGWPTALAPLLPLTVDAYAMTATRVWLVGSTRSARARRFARTNAMGAIALSLSGNAIYHLIAVQLVAASWVVVVAVGAVPALVLGLVSHLAVLRTQVDEPAGPPGFVPAQSGPRPSPVRTSRPAVRTGGNRDRTGQQLYEAAQAADQAHREAHGGRPLSRDALRQALQIGGARASELHRRLRDEHLQTPAARGGVPDASARLALPSG